MLIILFPYKFINFFYQKYQIKQLKEKFKNKIEIHDLSYIVSPNFNKAYKGKVNKEVKIFKKVKDWENYIKNKTKKEKNIFIKNFILPNSFKTIYINYLISKLKFNIIETNSGETFQWVQSKNLKEKINNFFKLLIFEFPYLLYSIKYYLFKKFLKILKFNRVFVTQCGFDGKKTIKPYFSNANEIKFIDYNSSDYENFKKNKITNKKKNFIVFLDGKTPAFAGDKTLFGKKINYDKISWYSDLNYFLKLVEKQFRSKVIIIPHPTVREFENIYYNKSFYVTKEGDATNKLISRCKFVLSITPTTAVSYCILYNKPITFIFNNQIIKKNYWAYKEMKELSKMLDVKIININDAFNNKDIRSSINAKKYKFYKY